MRNYKKGDKITVTKTSGKKETQVITKVTKNTFVTDDGSKFDKKTGKAVYSNTFVYLVLIENCGAFAIPFSSRKKAIEHFLDSLIVEIKELKDSLAENEDNEELAENYIMTHALPRELNTIKDVTNIEEHREILKKVDSYSVSVESAGAGDTFHISFHKTILR